MMKNNIQQMLFIAFLAKTTPSPCIKEFLFSIYLFIISFYLKNLLKDFFVMNTKKKILVI